MPTSLLGNIQSTQVDKTALALDRPAKNTTPGGAISQGVQSEDVSKNRVAEELKLKSVQSVPAVAPESFALLNAENVATKNTLLAEDVNAFEVPSVDTISQAFGAFAQATKLLAEEEPKGLLQAKPSDALPLELDIVA